MITIDEYKIADKELKKINLESDKLLKKQSQESNKLQNKYWDLENELNNLKRKEENDLTKKHEKEKEIINKQTVPHAKILSSFQRIMNMMGINKSQDNTDFTVYKYDYPRDKNGEVIRVKEGKCLCYPERQETPYTPIDTIKNDNYAKIQAIIVENGKPKNKFSLIIVGKTIFTEKIMKLLYSCGCPCHTDSTNIQYLLKDLPIENDLQEYYKRNKSKILKQDFFEQLPQIEKEYENVLKLVDNNEWDLAYWESKKEYYEEHCRLGTGTDEYKEVVKKICDIEKSEKNPD